MNNDKLKLIYKNRIDIVIGIEYVDFYENKYQTDFFIDLHINHKLAFNGLKDKRCVGKKKHLKRFNKIIKSIKDKQTNLIEIHVHNYNDEYWVTNGFHRTSTLSYYNLPKNLRITCDEKPPSQGWYPTNIFFFKNRGYKLKYCNYTMLNFLKYYQKDFDCIIHFQNSTDLSIEILNILKEHEIYNIDISIEDFKNNFKNNFIELLYHNEKWCRNGGSQDKALPCFYDGNSLKLYFIEKQDSNTLNLLHSYLTDNNNIHIPYNQKECNRLLDLLNYNTLLFMDKISSLYVTFPNFNKLFMQLTTFCEKNNIDTKKICITSSSVLSVYGIKDCCNMDLFIDKRYIEIFKCTNFNNHNQFTVDKHYSKHFEDIIYNPDNHFYYQGIKFCDLSIVLDYEKILSK